MKKETPKFKPKKTATVERVLNRAFTQVLFAGRQHIDLTDVLLSMLSEKEKQMIPILIEVSKIMDELFWQEAYGDKSALMFISVDCC